MSNTYYSEQNSNQPRKQNQSRFPPSQTKVNPEIINVSETSTQVKSMFTVNTHLNEQIDQHRDIFSQWTEPQDYSQKKTQSYRKKKPSYQQELPTKHYKKKQPVYQAYYKSNEKTAEFRYSKEEVIALYQENQDIGELDQWVADFPNCFTSNTLPPVNCIPLKDDPSEGIIPANSGYQQQQTLSQQQQSRNYRIAAKQKYYQQKQVEREDDDEGVPEWYEEDENPDNAPFELKTINLKEERIKEKKIEEEKVSAIMELLKENKQPKPQPKKNDNEHESEYKFPQTIYYKYEDLPEQLQAQCTIVDGNEEEEQKEKTEEKIVSPENSNQLVSQNELVELTENKEQSNEESEKSMDYEDLLDDNDTEKPSPIHSKPTLAVPEQQDDVQQEKEEEEQQEQNFIQTANVQKEQPQESEIHNMWEMLQNSEGLLESSNKVNKQSKQNEEAKTVDVITNNMAPQIGTRFAPSIQQTPVDINLPSYQQTVQQQQQELYQQQQQQQMYMQEQMPQQQVAAGQVFTNFIMIFTNCSNSDKVWYYKDPQDQIQGPFSTTDMQVWCNDQYFSGNLPIAWAQSQSFITLNQFKEKSTNLIKVSLQANQQIFSLLSAQVQQQLTKQFQLAQQQQQEQISSLKSMSPSLQKPFYSSPSPSLQSIQQQQALQQLEMQKQNAQQEITELSSKLKNLQEVIMQMQYQQIDIPKEYIITYQLCQSKMQQYQEFSRTVQYQINQIHQQIQQSLQQQQFTPPLPFQAQQFYQMKQQPIPPQMPSPSLPYQFSQQQTKSPNINQMMNPNYPNYSQFQQYDQSYQQTQQQQSLQFQNLAMFDSQQQQQQQQQQPQQLASPLAFQNLNQLQKENQVQGNSQNQSNSFEQNWTNYNDQEQQDYQFEQQ